MTRATLKLPSVELLRELIAYHPETGALEWKRRAPHHFRSQAQRRAWNARWAGRVAEPSKADGYVRLRIDGKQYVGHRLAWSIFHGAHPDFEIDHINGDRSDNRIANLRASDPATNNRNLSIPRNNTSGRVGVYYQPARWRASITINDSPVHLGYFDTFEEAVAAREAAERRHGFHENHGRAKVLEGAAA